MTVDVAVVGAGPVGLVTAVLLGQRGWRVEVIERWPQPYPLPRAVHFDHETARVLALCGVDDDLAAISEPATEYEWRDAQGRALLHFDWEHTGPSGWPTATMFSQPDLERILSRRAESLPGVTVVRGQEVVGLDQSERAARLTVRLGGGGDGGDGGHRTVSARYVVGCDGANSTVRTSMAASTTDLGFSYDWLIVDVVPPAGRDWHPTNLQVCDPRRPVTLVSGGPGRRRWEFMRLPQETLEELSSPATAWRLLEPWGLTPGNTTMERHAVYTFRTCWVDSWRESRILLAGDAAHLMPPFAGQGMCSGIRDAANLAWKLDLVLRGVAADALLDTYSTERVPHLRRAVEMSVVLGQVMCVTDPVAAAQRDEALIASGGDGSAMEAALPPAVLGPGVVAVEPDGGVAPPAGQLAVQGRVRRGSVVGLLDQVVGPGFMVLCRAGALEPLGAHAAEVLRQLGGRVVPLVEDPADHAEDHRLCHENDRATPDSVARTTITEQGTVVDVDAVHLDFLDRYGLAAVVVRPDFYVYGGVSDPDELPTLLDRLHDTVTAAV